MCIVLLVSMVYGYIRSLPTVLQHRIWFEGEDNADTSAQNVIYYYYATHLNLIGHNKEIAGSYMEKAIMTTRITCFYRSRMAMASLPISCYCLSYTILAAKMIETCCIMEKILKKDHNI